MIPLLAALALQGGWHTYTLGGFGFLLPAKPMPYSAPSAPKEARYWNLLHNGRNGVAVTIIPASGLDKAPPDALLAGGLTGLLDEGSTLTAHRDVVVGGWPGLEARWKDADGTFGAGRLVVAGGTLAMVLLSGDTAAAIEPPFARIAGAIKPPRTGTQTVAGPSFARYPVPMSPATVELPAAPQPIPTPAPKGQEEVVRRRIASNYGNRSYLAIVVELPEAMQNALEDEAALEAGLRRFNAEALEGLGVKNAVSAPARLGGVGAMAASSPIAGGKGFARVVSGYSDGRLYGFIAIVPAVLRNTPEVEGFFASVRLTTPAG